MDRIDIFHLPFYKKEVFTGSDRGLRFRIAKIDKEGQDPVLEVSIWPEPFAYQHTPEEQIRKMEFPFSEDGLDAAYEWLLGDARNLMEI